MARKKKKKRFIDGIFNYCDRWCERCAFTERCRVYDMEQKAAAEVESRDPENAAFWQSLTRILEQTKDMLRQVAAERGIDLDSLDLEAAGEREQRRTQRVRSNKLARQGEQYARQVRAWFKEHESLMEECGQGLTSRLQMELPGDNPEAEAVALTDAVQVVQWYQFQIAVKLMRALHQEDREEEEEEDDWRDAQEYDRDGSAKVALIGIDRSLGAWTVLRGSIEDDDDSILDMLLRLARLRDSVERAFPSARAFVRPGFDAPLET